MHGIIRWEVDQNVKHSAVENQMMQTSGEEVLCEFQRLQMQICLFIYLSNCHRQVWYWASRILRTAYTNFRVYVCVTTPPKPLDRFA